VSFERFPSSSHGLDAVISFCHHNREFHTLPLVKDGWVSPFQKLEESFGEHEKASFLFLFFFSTRDSVVFALDHSVVKDGHGLLSPIKSFADSNQRLSRSERTWQLKPSD
jgi:hypothetical protein